MKPFPASSAALRLPLSLCAAAAVMCVCIAAGAAARTAVVVVPATVAASDAQPRRVSPYTLANRRQASAAASSAVGLPSLPPSMRHGRQGLGRTPQPRAGAAGS